MLINIQGKETQNKKIFFPIWPKFSAMIMYSLYNRTSCKHLEKNMCIFQLLSQLGTITRIRSERPEYGNKTISSNVKHIKQRSLHTSAASWWIWQEAVTAPDLLVTMTSPFKDVCSSGTWAQRIWSLGQPVAPLPVNFMCPHAKGVPHE